MASAWDKFQEQIKAKMKETYSETVVEHNLNPRNLGSFSDADGYARVTGPCGDTIEMWLKVDGNTIAKAGFMTDGCGTTIASGSMITEIVKGKSLTEAQRISQKDVLNALDGLPEESEHCALLASDTLKAAIRDCLASKKRHGRKLIGYTKDIRMQFKDYY
jgi:nitrogen fixation NifU-like protein